jgi:MFS family permease
LLQKSSSHCFLGEVGADGHAGLPWSSITFLIKEINPVELLLGGKKYDTFIIIQSLGIGRSLAMHTIGLSATAISSTAAIETMVILPLPPLICWLSDRTGRQRFLAICYFVGTSGMLILSVSIEVWHFWIASAFMAIMFIHKYEPWVSFGN